jgi:hypothetical protein
VSLEKVPTMSFTGALLMVRRDSGSLNFREFLVHTGCRTGSTGGVRAAL